MIQHILMILEDWFDIFRKYAILCPPESKMRGLIPQEKVVLLNRKS